MIAVDNIGRVYLCVIFLILRVNRHVGCLSSVHVWGWHNNLPVACFLVDVRLPVGSIIIWVLCTVGLVVRVGVALEISFIKWTDLFLDKFALFVPQKHVTLIKYAANLIFIFFVINNFREGPLTLACIVIHRKKVTSIVVFILLVAGLHF